MTRRHPNPDVLARPRPRRRRLPQKGENLKKRRRAASFLEELVQDVTRDDSHTLAVLALLRNGHPGATPPHHIDDDGNGPPTYPDLTGEWAITPDEAAHLGHDYSRHIQAATRALMAADTIRRRMLPAGGEAKSVADPDMWCRNCLPAGHCAPRTSDGGQWCKWCRTVKQTMGFLPPPRAIELHHGGEHKKAAAAIQSHKRGGN